MISPEPLVPLVPRPAPRRAAFTLVELLVVIVIIAILAALVFPALSTVFRQGNQATSSSNLRQWYTGFSASLGDNDGTMPSDGKSSDYLSSDATAWYNRLPIEMNITPYGTFATAGAGTMPQLHQKSVWINPAVPLSAAVGGKFTFCYGFNDWLSTTAQPTQKFSRVEHPSLTILMGEKADQASELNPNNIRFYFGTGSTSNPVNDTNNSTNVLFCDGHVQLVPYSVFQNTDTFSASAYDQEFVQHNYAGTFTLTWLPNETATQ